MLSDQSPIQRDPLTISNCLNEVSRYCLDLSRYVPVSLGAFDCKDEPSHPGEVHHHLQGEESLMLSHPISNVRTCLFKRFDESYRLRD